MDRDYKLGAVKAWCKCWRGALAVGGVILLYWSIVPDSEPSRSNRILTMCLFFTPVAWLYEFVMSLIKFSEVSADESVNR